MIGKALWKILFVILHPSYWQSNHRTNVNFDRKILKLLELGEPVKITDNYYMKIGKHELWTDNHPYASFTLKGCNTVIPSRYTRHLLYKELRKAQVLID